MLWQEEKATLNSLSLALYGLYKSQPTTGGYDAQAYLQ